MRKHRHFEYSKIVVLTLPRLQELRSILQKFGECINYSVRTRNNAEIYFDSFDELSGFDNFQDNKIVSLDVECKNCIQENDGNVSISISFSPASPYETASVRCYYYFSDTEKEMVFISEFTRFLNKISTYDRSYKVCEWSSFLAFLVLGVYPVFLQIDSISFYQRARGLFPVVMVFFVSELIATFLYFLCSRLIWKKLFPRAIYAWGEEAFRYSKLEKLRSNLFWVVLIAPVISIIIGLILK